MYVLKKFKSKAFLWPSYKESVIYLLMSCTKLFTANDLNNVELIPVDEIKSVCAYYSLENVYYLCSLPNLLCY